MDNNEFSFDALFKCGEFRRCEGTKTSYAYNELEQFIGKSIKDDDISDELKSDIENYRCLSFDDGFKQGFCFAVKSLKFMLKI